MKRLITIAIVATVIWLPLHSIAQTLTLDPTSGPILVASEPIESTIEIDESSETVSYF